MTPELELEKTDAQAVLEHLVSGKPLDPEVSARVHARAEQITERLRATYGVIDDDTFQALLDDDDT